MDGTPNDIRLYLTVAETAQALSCSAASVRRLIARGELRAYRFGSLVRVASNDIGRAGRPVTRVRARREELSVTEAPPAPSGKRSSETWLEWAERREAAG